MSPVQKYEYRFIDMYMSNSLSKKIYFSTLLRILSSLKRVQTLNKLLTPNLIISKKFFTQIIQFSTFYTLCKVVSPKISDGPYICNIKF